MYAKILEIAKRFNVTGEIIDCVPFGNGHINDTFMVTSLDGDEKEKYILQGISPAAFAHPEQVIQNIDKVTDFLRKDKPYDPRKVITLISTSDGKKYTFGDDGKCYRMYIFIDDVVCIEHPENAEDFYQCAFGFGRFQSELADFDATQLFETIPDFHNTPKRYKDFLDAVEADVCGRAAGAEQEINFVKARAEFYPVLYDNHRLGKLPLRVTHNDTKSNNVMLDKTTKKALCVIDLDTVMPGFSVNDFGDAIRFGANTATEDEKDLSKVSINLEFFEAYVKGYLAGCGDKLTADEIMLLPEGSKMMTMECGMRFLADYLSGDTYFKTAYPEHNLIRCRTQFALAEDMENHWDEMKAIVRKYI